MLKRTLMAALLAGSAGWAGQALAQTLDENGNNIPPPASYAQNDQGTVVRERVVEQGPTIERQVIVGRRLQMPDHNTGVSRVNGAVGGAIGGYYINGSVPSENLPLDIPPNWDAYQH